MSTFYSACATQRDRSTIDHFTFRIRNVVILYKPNTGINKQ